MNDSLISNSLPQKNPKSSGFDDLQDCPSEVEKAVVEIPAQPI